MARIQLRVDRMKQGFMQFRNEGYSIEEIANYFDVAQMTVYNYLQEIAEENGVTRESLLYVPHKEHEAPDSRKEVKKPSLINIDELNQKFENVIKETEGILYEVRNVLAAEEDAE